ncbi:MAG: O-sialoglycoprotein endopeptidase [Bacillota bacterium]|nr:O-sialoglycoprotein endopeptidase [Bacillota bacterium]
MDAYMGIDTSCYTTSLAMVDREGTLIADERIMLDVNMGDRGLRQSEGVFQHIKNTGVVFDRIRPLVKSYSIAAVCASAQPRPVEGSYMPVFSVGENMARALSSALGIPYLMTSHQENHIAAGVWSAGGPKAERFLVLHLSGGTTELLAVSDSGNSYRIEIIGGTTDISAGQFIDRVGVSLGLPFPCGPHLEELAGTAGKLPVNNRIRYWTDGFRISYSGPETMAKRMLEEGIDKPLVALSVVDCISRSLGDILARACESVGVTDVLLVGGVSSNKHLRMYLSDRLRGNLFFPRPEYCKDNAVGNALLAKGA